MKLLGILGSPRRGGNSEVLLDKALEGARGAGISTEKIVLNELRFAPCQECGGCDKTGKCVINDQMQAVYQKIDGADALILASPIFFGSLPAQVKAMIDRYQCRWVKRFVLGEKDAGRKKSALILISASHREKFFKNAESIVKNWFAVLDVEFKDSLYCPDTDAKAKILEHPHCLTKAEKLGKKI